MTENRMSLHPLIGTAIRCALVVFLCAPIHAGFVMLFVLPLLAAGLIHRFYAAWKNPELRRLEKWKAGMWFLTVSGIALAHAYYHHAARETADTVLAAIFRYEREHGVYPENLQAVGLEARPAWRVAYFARDGKPFLLYPATFIVFDMYIYNFERWSWVYQPN